MTESYQITNDSLSHTTAAATATQALYDTSLPPTSSIPSPQLTPLLSPINNQYTNTTQNTPQINTATSSSESLQQLIRSLSTRDNTTISDNNTYEYIQSQIYAIFIRRLLYAQKDKYTLFIYIPTILCGTLAAILYNIFKILFISIANNTTDDSIIAQLNDTSTTLHIFDNITFINPGTGGVGLSGNGTGNMTGLFSDDMINNEVLSVTFLSDFVTILLYYFIFMSIPG